MEVPTRKDPLREVREEANFRTKLWRVLHNKDFCQDLILIHIHQKPCLLQKQIISIYSDWKATLAPKTYS